MGKRVGEYQGTQIRSPSTGQGTRTQGLAGLCNAYGRARATDNREGRRHVRGHFLLGSDEMHVGGGADAAASRMRVQWMTVAVTRGAKTRLSWLLTPFAVQISMLHRPELWWLREQQSY